MNNPLEDQFNKISAFAHVSPNAIIGKGNIIAEFAIIRDGVTIGDNNYIGPFCIIGEMPEKQGCWENKVGVWIGNNNKFTKQVTIDTGSERKTFIGNNVTMLKNSHVGHDAIIDNGVILSCNVCVGGFTEVGSECNFGLGAVVHQRVKVPPGIMLGMNSTITKTTQLDANFKYVGSPAKKLGANWKRTTVKPGDDLGNVGDANATC